MALRTREEYLSALRRMRPNVFKFGKPIEDVVSHPATRRVVESHARGIDAARDPALAPIFTTTSSLTGQTIHRHTSLMTSAEEMVFNSRMKREMYHLTGSCTGGLCVGWNGMNVMWSVTHDADQALGTDYHERLRKWALHFQKQGLIVAGALTDAKGNRALKPHQQADPYTNLHIAERRKDGIVLRGAKVMICGTAAAEEIFLLPGSVYREEDKDFCLACAVPRDVEGLTIVEARHPSDERELAEEGFDAPTETGITQAYLLFQDVFVPNERVFLAGEAQYSADIIARFTGTYRACIGACVAGQGDVMVGAAALIARANGLSTRTFREKLVQMEVNNETTFATGVGAILLGRKHPSGVWTADPLLAHVNKVHVATLPYETKRLCQEIGGIVETGCFPSYEDFNNPNYGPLIQRCIKAGGCSAETRAKVARLIEWLTIGAGVPGCMHGGGSPDGARMVVFGASPMKEYIQYASKIAGLTEDVPEPAK